MIADVLIATAILAVALATVAARGIFTAIALFVAHGLLLAFAWVRLDAMDVALTEAAIGAGLSGALLFGAAMRIAGAPETETPPGRAMTVAIALGCLGVTVALGAAVLFLPAPPSLAPQVAANIEAVGLGNPVGAVLMSFRGLDTLLESAVLVLAVIAVWSLAPEGGWGGAPGPVPPPPLPAQGPLALLARLLPPLGILVAAHVLWIGKDAPGGKFQAAAILAALWMLAWMAGRAAPPPVGTRWLRLAVAAGPALFIAIGLAGWVTQGAFLAYPPGLALPLIVLVELALTGSIAVALALLVLGPPEHRA